MRQKIGLIAGPLLFIIMLFLPHPEGMGYQAYAVGCVAVLMGLWWVTEAVPIPVTALIPLVAFPLLKIQSAPETSASYGSSHVFLFMGGFFVAIAMEKWNLHKRIALKIISFVGIGKRRLILGFMIATAFLSMWISNTATTLMMYPIGLAVIQSLEEIAPLGSNAAGRKKEDFSTAIMLAIAYSASIGGLATLIGTPPNIIFIATCRSLFPNAPEFSFMEWFLMVFPLVVLFIPTAWWYMVTFGFHFPRQSGTGGQSIINEKLHEMGKVKREELIVLSVFLLTAFGWIFRRDLHLGFFTVPGWSDALQLNTYVHDSTVAIGSAILLFVLPVNLKTRQQILTWDDAKKIPWGILILFGGGIALAEGFQSTGLSKWIAESMTFFHFLPPLFIILAVCTVMTTMTEFTSNTATASIFMPILAGFAAAVRIHPYVLMIPVTLSVSCAFVLPVSTPPNAIIFGSGRVKITDMIRIGIVFDIIGLLLVVTFLYYIIFPIMGINPSELPAWVR